MKVTGISYEKHRNDGDGIVRVIVDYVPNASRHPKNRQQEKTATLLYDMFGGPVTFEGERETREHILTADALREVAEAYMTMVYYGWEV